MAGIPSGINTPAFGGGAYGFSNPFNQQNVQAISQQLPAVQALAQQIYGGIPIAAPGGGNQFPGGQFGPVGTMPAQMGVMGPNRGMFYGEGMNPNQQIGPGGIAAPGGGTNFGRGFGPVGQSGMPAPGGFGPVSGGKGMR